MKYNFLWLKIQKMHTVHLNYIPSILYFVFFVTLKQDKNTTKVVFFYTQLIFLIQSILLT